MKHLGWEFVALARETRDDGRFQDGYVLDGEVNAGVYYLATGDFHIAPAGHDHLSLQSKAGALLLFREAQEFYAGTQLA